MQLPITPKQIKKWRSGTTSKAVLIQFFLTKRFRQKRGEIGDWSYWKENLNQRYVYTGPVITSILFTIGEWRVVIQIAPGLVTSSKAATSMCRPNCLAHLSSSARCVSPRPRIWMAGMVFCILQGNTSGPASCFNLLHAREVPGINNIHLNVFPPFIADISVKPTWSLIVKYEYIFLLLMNCNKFLHLG